MRVNEILVESTDLSEAPMGFVNRGLRKMGAGIVSHIPWMSTTAHGMQQGIAAGDIANQLWKELYGFIKFNGDTYNDVTADYLSYFLRSKGIKTFNLKGKIPLSKPDIEQLLLKAVQNNSRGFLKSQIPGSVGNVRAPGANAAPTPGPKMTYGQVKQAVLSLKPSERAKILQMLQGTAPTAPLATPKPRVRKQKTAV